MGFGCGCGHTNLIRSNRPIGGSPLAELVKGSMVGTGANHIGAAELFGGKGGTQGVGTLLNGTGKSIVQTMLRRGR